MSNTSGTSLLDGSFSPGRCGFLCPACEAHNTISDRAEQVEIANLGRALAQRLILDGQLLGVLEEVSHQPFRP